MKGEGTPISGLGQEWKGNVAETRKDYKEPGEGKLQRRATEPNRAKANTSQVMPTRNAGRDQTENDILQRAKEAQGPACTLEPHHSALSRSHKPFLMGVGEQILKIGRLSIFADRLRNLTG